MMLTGSMFPNSPVVKLAFKYFRTYNRSDSTDESMKILSMMRKDETI